MKNLPLVSIIIINFNGKQVLFDCLKSIEKLKYENFEVILVDNGSIDGSIASVESLRIGNSELKIIRNKQNVGFAPANNQGVKISKGEFVLLLNNDTKVSPSLLEKMVKKMQSDPSIGAMQPKIYLMDKPNYLDNTGSFLNITGFSNHWGFGKKDAEEFAHEREIFAAKGACLFTRRSLINKIGLFDRDFVSYFEESDFCWRVWLAGFRVIYFPDAFIYHKLGFTSKNLPQIEVNYHGLKNRIASFIKNFEIVNLVMFLSIHLFLLTGLAFYYLIKLEVKKSKMIFLSLWWNIINLNTTLKKRRIVQDIRVKSDSQIMPIIMRKTNIIALFSHFLKVEKNFK